MSNKNEEILYQDLEVPEIVWEKANMAFSQIGTEEKIQNHVKGGKRKKLFRIPKVAAAAMICCCIFGTTVAAMEIISLYKQRMEDMEEQEIEGLYQLAYADEANSLNRPFMAEEGERYQALTEEYEKNGRFPEKSLTIIAKAEDYSGQGVAIEAGTRTIYLPEGSLSDEELLEIIDFNHKMTYSIYEKNREQILAQGDWESRMEAMTDWDVDRIYLAYCASNLETGGGYSRELIQTEKQRYEELNHQYETEGVYAEIELNIIKTVDEYTGSSVAFCEENSSYCLPDGVLTDYEILQIIDFEHKIPYCFDRINYEVMIGLRECYPKAE
ncbi:MAG: hypothetical protein HFH82_11645 [Lachnospiraceae bacterium]|nr:hypothetical protein [Lachnospiraceae bacterium]